MCWFVLVDMEGNAIDNLYLGYIFLDDVDYLVEVRMLSLCHDSPLPQRRYTQTRYIMYHDHSCDHLHICAPHVFFTIHLKHMHHTGSQENDAVMEPKEQKVTEVEEHEEEL